MKPEKIQLDKDGLPKFKYVICMCRECNGTLDGKAIRIAPADAAYNSYKWKCDICGMEGVYNG